MEQEELTFEEFLAARMRDKGLSLKRLSEATGIASSHLENMLHGNFEDMPSTPYFRGYVMRVAKVLDFDGVAWWERLKKESIVKNSGPTDALPRNRFTKKSPPKLLWAGIAIVALVVIYFAFQFPRIFGKPILVITYPDANPYTTTSSTITIMGTVQNADVLYLSNGDASSTEEIPIAPDGTWQKTVLLQNGLNPFQFAAKKLLGGETDITEQIFSASSGFVIPTSTASSTPPASSTPTSTTSTKI
jgi:cytoskeletal protein RodZ